MSCSGRGGTFGVHSECDTPSHALFLSLETLPASFICFVLMQFQPIAYLAINIFVSGCHVQETGQSHPNIIYRTSIIAWLINQAGRFSFPPSTSRIGLSTPLPEFDVRFGLLAPIARSMSKLSSSRTIIPPLSHFSSSRLGSARKPPRSMRTGDSTIGGNRARGSLDVRGAGGVLLRSDKDVAVAEEESAEVSESNLVTNAASARRSSSSCSRAYIYRPSHHPITVSSGANGFWDSRG